MTTRNSLLKTDSYKAPHWLGYPPGTETIFAYIEARGTDHAASTHMDVLRTAFVKNPELKELCKQAIKEHYAKYTFTQFFGLQMYLKEYLLKGFTEDDVLEADEVWTKHGVPFNKEGWLRCLDRHGGAFPVQVSAVAEGLQIPFSNILVSIENTDTDFPFVPGYLEPSLLRGVWYPSTVSTISKVIKNVIKEYMEATCDNLDGLPFKLHGFGARGVSSGESAGLGDAGHLVNFRGTDVIEGVMNARKYYHCHCDMAAYSIPASEHSTMTSWGGRDGELHAIHNMLVQFAKPGKMVAIVSDSYDLQNAVNMYFCHILKDQILASGAKVVVRPDSGDPPEVVLITVASLGKGYGTNTNTKNYKDLHPAVGVIQGDGISSYAAVRDILENLKVNQFSADNITFGMGGPLLQVPNRDTFGWAMKASAACIDGRWIDIYKDPITDPFKVSKRGRLMLYRNRDTGEYFTGREAHGAEQKYDICLRPVSRDGKLLKDYTFNEVRANSNA